MTLEAFNARITALSAYTGVPEAIWRETPLLVVAAFEAERTENGKLRELMEKSMASADEMMRRLDNVINGTVVET